MNVTILNSTKEEVCRKVKRIVNKCEKNHVPCVFNVSEPYTKLILLKNNKSFEVELVDLEIDVEFKFNGWSSLGMVQRKDGIVQCYFDDPGLIKQYKDTDFHCDHCHKNVTRNSVVVLENESGERKVVGTSCVKEFTSGLDGNLIAEVNDYIAILKIRDSELRCLMQGEDDADVFFESHGFRTYDVVDIVSAAKRLIDKYGFEPSSSYNATWKFIMNEYDRTNIENEAVSAIDWIKSLSEEESTKSSYLFNLKQIIDAEYCTGRHFGLLASLIPSYRKSEYKRLLDQNNSNNKKSEYIGNVGDKLSIKVTYLNTYTYETQFGNSNIHLFVDNDGNIFKWSTSSNLEYTIKDQSYSQWHILDKGAIVQLSGKIKAHDEYRGQKQTVLTRCKYEVLESKDKDEKLAELEEYYATEHKAVVDDCLKEIMNSWL
jgi:hypothetical protein